MCKQQARSLYTILPHHTCTVCTHMQHKYMRAQPTNPCLYVTCRPATDSEPCNNAQVRNIVWHRTTSKRTSHAKSNCLCYARQHSHYNNTVLSMHPLHSAHVQLLSSEASGNTYNLCKSRHPTKKEHTMPKLHAWNTHKNE